MIVTCEAFALADKLGLSREAMFDVVSTSSGYSLVDERLLPRPGRRAPNPSDNGYKPGFAADLMLKDLRLAQVDSGAVCCFRCWSGRLKLERC
jgi:3-hydroxyisobutyrate dehydrogenase